MDISNITNLNTTYSIGVTGVCQCEDLTLANLLFKSQYIAWLFPILTVLVIVIRALKSCNAIRRPASSDAIVEGENLPLSSSTSVTINARDCIV